MPLQSPSHHHRPVAEAMEPRLLYAADFAPAAFMASSDAGPDASHQRLIEASAASTSAPVGTEIVFVDARVPDQATLLADLAAQARQGRAIEVVLIRADEDGLDRITQALSGRQDVAALHLISHGQAGSVQLGNTVLDEQTLLTRAQALAAWSTALGQDADLLIYGCDVGAQDGGLALVQGLAALTGADVAASDDLTGSSLQGGDWQLEVQTGHIEARLAPSTQEQGLFAGVLAAATPIGKGDAVWATSGANAAQLSNWDGFTAGTAVNTSNTGQWTLVTSAQSPKADQSIVVGVDTAGTVKGEVINGSTSSLIPITMGSGLPTNRQGFAVAYEQTSGDAMLVWNDGTHLRYSIYNGSSWTAAATVAAYTGAAPQHMQLVSQPGGDGMALVISDANAQDHALIWDGSSWGHAITLGGTSASQTAIAVAYEAQSGHVMVAYSQTGNANVFYSVFNGTSWSAGAQAGNYLEAATPQHLTLASDPTSNRIALGMVAKSTTQTFTSFTVWNQSGSQSWGNRTTPVTRTTTTDAPTVAVAYESQSGELLAVYGTSANTVSFQTLGSSGVWSSVQTGPNASGPAGAIKLSSDPTTDSMMLGVQNTSGRLSYTAWTGSAWSTSTVATTNTGSTVTPAFTWLFQGNIAGNTTNTLWLGSSQANSPGWNGTNSVTATEVVALQDPGLNLGSTTSGTFSHVFDAAAFGATAMNDIAWVSRDVVMSSGITVHRGDVLFSVPSTTTLTSVNSLSAAKNDVILFRPTVAGDYSSGTFTRALTITSSLLGLLGLGNASIRGLALVEQTTTFGYYGTTVAAGTILFTYGDGNSAATDILSYKIGDLSIGTFIAGADINIDRSVTGLEVISGSTPMANYALSSSAMLLSFAQDDSQVGNNRLKVAATDVVGLTVYSTTTTNNSAIAVATLLVEGADVGITSGYIDGLAVVLDAAPVIDSNGGGATASLNVNENTTAVTTVTGHDDDAYGTLSYSIIGGSDASRFTIDSHTGVLHFISAPDFEKPLDSTDKGNSYVVTVAASDGTYRDTQTLTVNVRNVNETPVIISGGGGTVATLYVADQTTAATTVQASDQDAGDVLVYTLSGGADQALFTINSTTGVVSFNALADFYSPADADANNVYQVKVRVTDALGTWDEQTLNITVQPSNLPPTITSDGGGASQTLVVDEFHTAVTTVQATDPEGAQLTYAISGGSDRARFTIDALTGALAFASPPDTLAPEDTGGINRYVVQVSASDGPLTAYQTLTIEVHPYVRPGNTVPLGYAASEDTPLALSGLAVTDPDAGSAAITVTLTVQHGTLSVKDDVASGLGMGDIQYDIDHRTATLTGSVSAINSTLSHGLGVVYQGDADYNGSDILTMVTVDGVNTGSAPPLTATDTVAITVSAVNDPPQAVILETAYPATEQTSLALHNTGLRIADPDGGQAHVTLSVGEGTLTAAAGTTGVTVGGSGTHTVTLTGDISQINAFLDGSNGGTLFYRDDSDAPTALDTLVFTVDDLGNTGSGGSHSHAASVGIQVNAVNDAPVAHDDSATVNEDGVLHGSTVLANDVDAESTALTTATLDVGPRHGTLTLDSSGSYTYTPDADFNGTDTFTYQTTDGTLSSNIATVTITVSSVNDAPVAAHDSATVNEDTVLHGSTVLADDTDVDNANLTAALVSGPGHGTLTFNSDGTYTYTPDADFNGTDTFTYQATDGTLSSNTATVTITVSSVNDAPVANGDSSSVNEDTVLTGSTVLANDTDVDSANVTAALVSSTGHGALTFNSDGTYTYTPDADFNGTDTFTYQATDGTLSSSTATVTITVTSVNDAPVSFNDSAAIDEDTVLNGSTVLANDTDGDSGGLTAVLVSGTSHGSLVLHSDGSYTYTPDADFNGTDTFSYQASDGELTSSTATVTLTIAAVNDAPVIATNALSISQGGTAEPQLVLTDIDSPAADLVISASGIAAGHFVNAGGQTVTQFRWAEAQAHQIVFIHDGSAQSPSYVLSVSDGLAVSTPSAVQTNFAPVVISAPAPAPAEPPAPPKPEADSDKDKKEPPPAVAALSGALAAGTQAAAAAPLAFFIDVFNNAAPTGAGFTVAPPVSRYGPDTAPRLFNASAATVAGEEGFKYGWLKALGTAATDAQNLRSSLDALREQLQNEGSEHKSLVASSIAVSTGLSVGYVIWLVRGGALIGSMLSAMPAWQMIDPLPVLARGRGGNPSDTGDDDASVEHIFDDEDSPPPPRPNPPPSPRAAAGTDEATSS